jgi:hypothetical protein
MDCAEHHRMDSNASKSLAAVMNIETARGRPQLPQVLDDRGLFNILGTEGYPNRMV